MQSRSAFTLVELIVTISVIAILTTIVSVGMSMYQVNARDAERSSKAATLSEGLERYYEKNGEYPSPRSLTNNYADNTPQSVAAILSVDAAILQMPKAQETTSYSISSDLSDDNDVIAYTARSSVNNTSCQTKKDGGCDEYTLNYTEEFSNEVVTIESRKKGRPASQPTAADEAPQAPELSAGLDEPNVFVESSETLCESPLVAKYAFQHKVNSGAWSVFSLWSTQNEYSISGTAGNIYTFKAMSRCDNGTAIGPQSPESAEESVAYPVGAPLAPVTSVALSGANVVATVAPVTCPAGTTAQYSLRNKENTGAWSAYSTWSTTRTASRAASQGVKYTYQAQARCVGATTSPASTGKEAIYTHPILAPAAPTVTVSTSGTLTTWSWTATTCPSGTTPRYQYQSLADWNYTSAWFGPSTALSNTWTTSNQGYEYTRNIQAHCYNVNATSPWSASGTKSYIRPLTAPGAPTGFVSSMTSDRRVVNWSWTVPACGAGATYNGIHKAHWNEGRPEVWHPAPSAQGRYAPSMDFKVVNDLPHTSGTRMRTSAVYVCINTTTGRSSAWGPEGTSGTFIVP